MRRTPPPQRIALLMPRANVHSRSIFRGITRYARPFKAWSFHLGLPDAASITALKRWKPAGIIATLPQAHLEERLLKLGLPLVNVSSDLDTDRANRVITDNPAVGRLAAAYFLRRGYRHLGFCGNPQSDASITRGQYFAAQAREAGAVFHDLFGQGVEPLADDVGWVGSSRDRKLQKVIRGLPKPIGILACHDPMAMLVNEACREANVRVPQEVAILGVDNDTMLCEMAYPSLSSVQTAQEQIGFEAARRLEELMRREEVVPTTLRLPPQGITTRQSTDASATDDPLVAQAMRFISEHADQPIRVSDVVEHVGVSRRNLENRFRVETGRSVLPAIQLAHIAMANTLMSQTNMTLDQIAEASGFNSRERFSHVYRQITGKTARTNFPLAPRTKANHQIRDE